MEQIKYQDIPLERSFLVDSALYRLMGYKGNVPSDDILQLIDSLWNRLLPLCTPRVGWRIVEEVTNLTEDVRMGDVIFHTGPVIAQAMEEASSIAVFTVTLGAGYDEWMGQVKAEGDIMVEFVANSIASIVADGATEAMIKMLSEDAAADGLKITNNYSPGYCGWPLAEQQQLFSFLPEGITCITLTESCLMLPIKSVSGIIGVGRDVLKRPYGCAVCDMKGRCNSSKI